MSRQLRIQYPGAWYHVFHRGAARQNIYEDDIDRATFLLQLAETAERYGLEVHAYCLMTNHFHLVLRTPQGNLATGMRHLNSTYSQRFNRARGIDGPLFKGRYGAQLIGEDEYLLTAIRYVHRNPIEAGLESRLGDYQWSSLVAYLESSKQPDWLAMDWVHSRFPSIEEFRDFTSIADPSEAETFDGETPGESRLVVGSAAFVEASLRGKVGDVETRSSLSSVVAKPTVAAIEAAVAAVTQCSPEEFHEPLRGTRNLPRLVAIRLSAELAGLDHGSLAMIYGYKNEFGVESALQAAARLAATDCDFERIVNQSRDQLKLAA